MNGILPYISADPKGDRDAILRGRKLAKVNGELSSRLCFRNLFIDDEDVKIGKIVEQYFLAVRERWPKAWDFRGEGLILNRTNGYRALISMLGRVYTSIAAPGELVEQAQFKAVFDRVDADDLHFSTDNYKPGSTGEADLRRFLIGQIFGELPLMRGRS